MPSDRTFVTEIATALGMVGDSDLASVIVRRPPEMSNVSAANWDDLTALWRSGTYETDFTAGFLNGQASSSGREDAGHLATRSCISSAASTSRGSFTTQAPLGSWRDR